MTAKQLARAKLDVKPGKMAPPFQLRAHLAYDVVGLCQFDEGASVEPYKDFPTALHDQL